MTALILNCISLMTYDVGHMLLSSEGPELKVSALYNSAVPATSSVNISQSGAYFFTLLTAS